MRKDPTEFRARFKTYKEGKMPYENGLPKYGDGKVNWPRWDDALITSYTIPFIEDKAIKLTNAGRATGAVLSTNLLDSLADNAMRAGIPVRTAIGLATKESTLGNPTDDRSAWNLSSRIRKLFNEVYPGTVQHINNGTNLVDGIKLINYHKGNIDHEMFNGAQGKSIIQEGLEFYKTHPDKYNPGLKGYQKAVDARGDEVMNSPEVKKWYKEWEAKQMKIMRPKSYKIETNILNTAAPKFGAWKDGKLPEYADGKIHIKPANRGKFTALKKRTGHSASWFKAHGTPAQKKMAVFALNAKKWHHADGKLPEYGDGKGDGMRYLWDDREQEWDRITDNEYARAFADLTVTPKSNRLDIRTNPVYHDPRLKNAGYVTESMLEDEANSVKQRETGIYAPGLEQVSPEFDLLALSPILKEGIVYGTKRIADKAGLFVRHPNSFTRGIGGEAGLQDLIESGLVRGNPVGTEVTAKAFGKLYNKNRGHFADIMNATGRKDILHRFYNRTLTEDDFNAIKEAAKKYKSDKPLSNMMNRIQLMRLDVDPLAKYSTYRDYLLQLASDRLTLANATSLDDSGLPLAYFYDDGRNPLTSGHDYAASKYGVRINNADLYHPRIFEGHLHYSMPNAVYLNDPNVELFRKGPLGITIRMRKPTK